MAPRSREYDFINGPETSTLPDPADPSGDFDTVTLDYLNNRSAWAESTATLTTLAAIAASDRVDGQARKVLSDYSIWVFRSASVTAADGTSVIAPDAGSGRWHLFSSGSGSGSGGGGSTLDLAVNKVSQEKYGVFATPVPYSIARSFVDTRPYWEARLIESYTASSTNLKMVVNPIFVNSSDKNFDTTTNWSAGGAGASLTTSATVKVGTASLSLDKNGTAVDAYISNTTNTYNAYFNQFAFLWVNLPSVTNLSNVFIQLSADTSFTNSARYNLTTSISGAALATGWNLLKFSLAGTPSTTTGSGWTRSATVAATRIGVTTSTSGQTYTAILFDALCFGDSTGLYLRVGDEVTLYDTSNIASFIIDSSNSTYQGSLTLAASMASSFTAGTASSAGVIVRTMFSEASSKASATTGLSGSAVNTQLYRARSTLSESLASATIGASVGFNTSKILRVLTVSSPNITLDDPGNNSAQYLSGNTIRVVRPVGSDGYEQYLPVSVTPTLSSNATHLSGVTTLPLSSVTSIQVGDIIFKDQIGTPQVSLVAEGVNESFVNMDFDRIEVVNDGLQYPQPQAVWAHWELGGPIAKTSKKGTSGLTLSETGTVPKTFPFTNRQSAAGPFSSSNFYSLTSTQAAGITGEKTGPTGFLGFSMWVYLVSSVSSQSSLVTKQTAGVAQNWDIYINSSNVLTVGTSTGTMTGGSPTVGRWNHIAVVIDDETTNGSGIYLNGVKTSGTLNPDNGAQPFFIGAASSGGVNAFTAGYIADLVIWAGVKLTDTEVANLYNRGYPRRLGNYDSYSMRYEKSGLTGQKLSMKISVPRGTDADDFYLTHVAMAPK